MQRNRLCMWLLLLLCALSCISCSKVSGQEVRISTQEWTELKSIYSRQRALTNQSLTDYLLLSERLEISRQELAELRMRSVKLQLRLGELEETSKSLQSSLTTANESLEQLRQEMKRKQRILKMQRTIGYSVAVLLLYDKFRSKK